MRLIGLLVWYDEPSWCLAELVGSLARAGVDHLVAVDGAYLQYPEGRAQSPSEQSQTILGAAQGAGMGVSLHLPQEPWVGNEIEKRSFLFQAGHQVAEDGDWLFVVDADFVVTEAIGLKYALEKSEREAGEVLIENTFDGSREGVYPLRLLYRAQETGIHLRDNHFTYVTGDGKLLYEGFRQPSNPDLVDAETLHFVRVDHRDNGRSQVRQDAWRRYSERVYERRLEVVKA